MRATFTLYGCILLCVSGAFLLLPYEFDSEVGQHILISIKVPIWLTCLIVGFGLCSASASLQILLKNPLADPSILGIASGASLMAALYFLGINLLGISTEILLSASLLSLMLPLMCFLGAMLSGALIFALAKKIDFSPAAVILSGVAVSTIIAASVAWLYLIMPPSQLQNLTFWLMGSLSNASWGALLVALPLTVVSLWLLYKMTHQLNWMLFGEFTAISKGLDVRVFQRKQLILIALLVGTAVSIAGSIAFIGLIIPHLLRQIHGHDNRLIVPLSGVCGAILLVACAIVNEQWSTAPIPISLLTATIGGPVFIWLLLKGVNVNRWQTSK